MSKIVDMVASAKERRAAERAARAAQEAARQKRLADEGKFSYRFTDHPEWSLEDARVIGIAKARAALAALGHEHVDRLKGFEIENYIPVGPNDPHATGYVQGGLVMVTGFLAREGDEGRGLAFKTTIPRCIHPADLGRVFEQFAVSLPNAVAVLLKQERAARAQGAIEVAGPAANDAPVILGPDGAPAA
jgi:hypothetical protein